MKCYYHNVECSHWHSGCGLPNNLTCPNKDRFIKERPEPWGLKVSHNPRKKEGLDRSGTAYDVR